MTIKILSHGLSTTVQDLGRVGYYHLGIPISGAMDRFSLKVANLLVGNEEGAACLEAVFIGPKIEFLQDATIAITGADIPVRIDGDVRPTWTSLKVQSGQVLSFDYLSKGARIYIAISGGIDVPVVLKSRSTYLLGGLGGYSGRALADNDVLAIIKSNKAAKIEKSIPEKLRRSFANQTSIRVLPGLYWHRITKEAGEGFFQDDWSVAPECDRIGYRFKGGSQLEFVPREPPFGAGSDPSNIVDSCYPYGSIQVPSGTEPIVLHRDAVSGGGYFMLGTVISADMDIIGQLQPNSKVKFEKVELKYALEARKSYNSVLDNVKSFLS